jgi:protein TonB
VEVDIMAPAAEAPSPAAANTPAAHLASSVPVRRVRAHQSPRLPAAPASAAVAEPTNEEPPRFALSAGTVATGPGIFEAPEGTPAGTVAAASSGDRGGGDAVIGEHDVDLPARLVTSTPPVYPPPARAAEIEADLPFEIVVAPDGHVASARALARAGYGLDDAALRALLRYRFSPALRAGRAVAVRMRWVVQFRLE